MTMRKHAVLGYATFMNPAIAEGHGLHEPHPVTVLHHQRLFGFPDLAGRAGKDVFAPGGTLRIADSGATTVRRSRPHHYNGVLYMDVSPEALVALDQVEAASHLVRTRLDLHNIKGFAGSVPEELGNRVVWVYEARKEVRIEEVGPVGLVRMDVLPNPDYLVRCRTAAAVHGPEFALAFEETTYLADRTTPLTEWKPSTYSE